MQIIRDTLSHPEKLLHLQAVSMKLDSMNIKADETSSANVDAMGLIEFLFRHG